MNDRALVKFVVYILLILIIVETPTLYFASEDEEMPHPIVSLPIINPIVPFRTQFELENHTHQEDRSPFGIRDSLMVANGTVTGRTNFTKFTVDGMIVEVPPIEPIDYFGTAKS